MTMNPFLKGINVSNEAIDYQFGNKFYDKVVNLMDGLRTGDLQYAKKIEQLLMKEVGIKIELEVETSKIQNAWVRIADINKDNVIFGKYMATAFKDSTSKRALREASKLVSFVDRANCKISGWFSEIPFPITMTTGLINNENFTPAELASIFLHECGHAFTYLEHMSGALRTNLILTGYLNEYRETNDDKWRLTIINKMKDDKLLEDKADGTTILQENKDDQIVVLLTSHYKYLESQPKDLAGYACRNYEAASDQFVTRLGGGGHLVSGLHKLWQNDGKNTAGKARFSYWFSVTIDLFVTIGSVVSFVLTGGVFPFMCLFLNVVGNAMIAEVDTYWTYDKGNERSKRIRNDMIQAMKHLPYGHKEIKKMIDMLDAMDKDIEANKTMMDYLSRRGIWVDFIQWVVPTYRRLKTETKRQQALEELMNNDLFIARMKLLLAK